MEIVLASYYYVSGLVVVSASVASYPAVHKSVSVVVSSHFVHASYFAVDETSAAVVLLASVVVPSSVVVASAGSGIVVGSDRV